MHMPNFRVLKNLNVSRDTNDGTEAMKNKLKLSSQTRRKHPIDDLFMHALRAGEYSDSGAGPNAAGVRGSDPRCVLCIGLPAYEREFSIAASSSWRRRLRIFNSSRAGATVLGDSARIDESCGRRMIGTCVKRPPKEAPPSRSRS